MCNNVKKLWNLGKYSLRTTSNMWTFKPLTLSFSIIYVLLVLCSIVPLCKDSFDFTLRTSIWTEQLFLTDFNYVYLCSCMFRKMYVLSNKEIEIEKNLENS